MRVMILMTWVFLVMLNDDDVGDKRKRNNNSMLFAKEACKAIISPDEYLKYGDVIKNGVVYIC